MEAAATPPPPLPLLEAQHHLLDWRDSSPALARQLLALADGSLPWEARKLHPYKPWRFSSSVQKRQLQQQRLGSFAQHPSILNEASHAQPPRNLPITLQMERVLTAECLEGQLPSWGLPLGGPVQGNGTLQQQYSLAPGCLSQLPRDTSRAGGAVVRETVAAAGFPRGLPGQSTHSEPQRRQTQHERISLLRNGEAVKAGSEAEKPANSWRQRAPERSWTSRPTTTASAEAEAGALRRGAEAKAACDETRGTEPRTVVAWDGGALSTPPLAESASLAGIKMGSWEYLNSRKGPTEDSTLQLCNNVEDGLFVGGVGVGASDPLDGLSGDVILELLQGTLPCLTPPDIALQGTDEVPYGELGCHSQYLRQRGRIHHPLMASHPNHCISFATHGDTQHVELNTEQASRAPCALTVPSPTTKPGSLVSQADANANADPDANAKVYANATTMTIANVNLNAKGNAMAMTGSNGNDDTRAKDKAMADGSSKGNNNASPNANTHAKFNADLHYHPESPHGMSMLAPTIQESPSPLSSPNRESLVTMKGATKRLTAGCTSAGEAKEKKSKRLQSNRESAKRSRQRKMDRITELEVTTAKLRVELSEVHKRLAESHELFGLLEEQNESLQEKLTEMANTPLLRNVGQLCPECACTTYV